MKERSVHNCSLLLYDSHFCSLWSTLACHYAGQKFHKIVLSSLDRLSSPSFLRRCKRLYLLPDLRFCHLGPTHDGFQGDASGWDRRRSFPYTKQRLSRLRLYLYWWWCVPTFIRFQFSHKSIQEKAVTCHRLTTRHHLDKFTWGGVPCNFEKWALLPISSGVLLALRLYSLPGMGSK